MRQKGSPASPPGEQGGPRAGRERPWAPLPPAWPQSRLGRESKAENRQKISHKAESSVASHSPSTTCWPPALGCPPKVPPLPAHTLGALPPSPPGSPCLLCCPTSRPHHPSQGYSLSHVLHRVREAMAELNPTSNPYSWLNPHKSLSPWEPG